MRQPVRISRVVALWLFATTVIGCETLGISPPANQLLPETKAIRNSAPVPAPVPRELAKELHPPFVVEPGDTLLVQPAELDAPLRLPPDQTVFPDGTIDLGAYGRPLVAGKTQEQIAAEVQQLINTKEKAKEQIHVIVRIVGRNSKVYYVLGDVNAPGAFPINGRETVLDGIIAAGGLTRKASEQNIVVSRPSVPEGCRTVLPVCYTNIVQLGDTTTNYQLQPGDRIYVPGKGLFEGLFPKRCARNGPCNHPQVSCWNSNCAGPHANAVGSNIGATLPSLPSLPPAPLQSTPLPVPATLPVAPPVPPIPPATASATPITVPGPLPMPTTTPGWMPLSPTPPAASYPGAQIITPTQLPPPTMIPVGTPLPPIPPAASAIGAQINAPTQLPLPTMIPAGTPLPPNPPSTSVGSRVSIPSP